MGCCTSTARVNRPVRALETILPAHQFPSLQEAIEEDEKTDEKQPISSHCRTKSSTVEAPQALPTAPNASEDVKKKEDPQKSEANRSVVISRKPSVFDLYRENILDLQYNQDINEIDFRKSRLQTDESVFKITIQQHEEILRFVDERIRCFNIGILRLYDNLCKNGLDENQDLLLFLEELRHNSKDIENCVEDLLSYPFANDQEYMAGLQIKNRLIRKLISEYNNYQSTSQNYKDFRNNLLKVLLKYDPNLPNIKVSSLELAVVMIQKSPSTAYKGVENSVVFIPREEMRRGEDLEKDDLQHIDFNFDLNLKDNGAKERDYGRQKEYDRHEILKSMQDFDKQEQQDAVAKYYGLEEELEGLNEGFKSVQGSWNTVKEEIKEYKRGTSAGDQDDSGRNEKLEAIKKMHDNLLSESETLGRQYIELQTEVRKLKVRLNESNGRQIDALEFDSEEKMNEMEFEIERKLKELVEITLVLPMMYRDIETQKKETSEGLDPLNNAWEQEESKSSEKEQQVHPSPNKTYKSPGKQKVVVGDMLREKQESTIRESKELRIAGPKTFTNDSVRNLSTVLKGDVNEVSVSEFETRDISIPYLQKRKMYNEYSRSYGLSHSTAANSRENQNTLSQIDNTELHLSHAHRMY